MTADRTIGGIVRHGVFVGGIMLIVTVGTSALQQPPPLPPIVDGLAQLNGREGPWLFFLGTLVSTLVSLYVQGRNRRWDIEQRRQQREWDAEDRARVAAEIKEKAEEEARVVRQRTEELEIRMRLQHQSIEDKIEQNTQVSVEAFKEANSINTKIAALGAAISDARPDGHRKSDAALLQLKVFDTVLAEKQQEKLDAIKETGEDTNRAVHELKP